MRLLARILLLPAMIACGAVAWGAPATQDPGIGYVYPAGGRQGSSFRVIVAGQRLRSVSEAYISGNGVRASVIDYVGAGGPLTPAQQEELRRRLQKIRDDRMPLQRAGNRAPNTQKTPDPANTTPVALPDLPELRNLEQQTAKQLRQVADMYLNRQKRPKPPIAEEVTLEVTIDPGAAPGDREFRLLGPNGLSNPLVFQVGDSPEAFEQDPNEEATGAPSPAQPPIVLNGRIMPGEVDRFSIQLKRGQLVVAVQARKLIPYLADAVPGWFQAVVALYDANGNELACGNECGFNPDPAFVIPVPRDGAYTLEIRDALYRGRQDFVYRVNIGGESQIKALFPYGTRGGILMGAPRADRESPLKFALAYFQSSGQTIPQLREKEPNDTGQTANPAKLPQLVVGSIDSPGDKDVFRFEGRAGDEVAAEVYARRMGSALDSLLRLIDASGRVVAWNDDHEDIESGLLTHHSDSFLMARLPATGRYFVQVSDAQGHGGPEYRYCLRIGPPQPDFALRLAPSALNVPSGRAVVATIYVARKDGWDGEVELALNDAPAGFTLSGARIPKGRDHVRITLLAPSRWLGRPIAISLEGRAQIGGKTVTRPVIPAEDMMQAFAYRHLVPSEQLMVMVTRGGRVSPTLDIAPGERLRIPAGGSAQVTCSLRSPMPANTPVRLELSDPPAGVTLQNATVAADRVTLTLKADAKHVGYMDNLIVEAFTEIEAKQAKKGAVAQKQRIPLGVLPAIPFEIAKP